MVIDLKGNCLRCSFRGKIAKAVHCGTLESQTIDSNGYSHRITILPYFPICQECMDFCSFNNLVSDGFPASNQLTLSLPAFGSLVYQLPVKDSGDNNP